jgi:DNA polymerase-3 subunit beta
MFKTSELSQALSILSAATGKGTITALQCVRIDAKSDLVELTTSNLEMEITTIVAAEVKTPMATLIDHKKLSSFAATAQGNPITLSMVDNKAKAKAKATSTFQTLPFDNFPAMNVNQSDQITVEVDAAALSNAINNIIYCVAKDDVRYYLNGIFLRIQNGVLSLFSSDGARLSTASINVASTESIECIVHGDVAKTIAALFKDGVISIKLSANSTIIDNGNIRLIAKNIDAKYPNFQKVFDMDRDNIIVVNKPDWINAINSVVVTANEKSKGITLSVSNSEMMTLSSEYEGESTEIDMPCKAECMPILVSFNAEYLLSAAKKSNGDITLMLDDACSSLMIKDGGEATHIVMPMRI